MSANKKSSILLPGLLLAVACLMGVFAIKDASTANASPGEYTPMVNPSQPIILISPTELNATLQPGEQVTQTLWITNTGDAVLSFTIFEMTGTLRTSNSILLPIASPVVEAELQSQVEAMGSSLAIIYLREKPDVSAASRIPGKAGRSQYVYDRLLETASHSQDLFNWLAAQGAKPQRLLIANAIAATLNSSQLVKLYANPLVRLVGANHQYKIPLTSTSGLIGPPLPGYPTNNPDTVEWNIAKIRADEAWQTFGVTGQGAVVGVIDTGVMFNHLALVNSYRGNLGEDSFDHNYNWFDFVNGQPVPYDDNGHGTFGAGIVSGNDGGENQIGVAPGADWIAAKVCSGGGMCDLVDLLGGLDWMIAPTQLDGTAPDPTKAPDIVLGMWGIGSCDPTFETIMETLRAANILPVFPPGGGGPNCGSLSSPGDLPATLAAGATDQTDLIAPFSGRGPGCFGGIKPDVAAPGVEIRSSTIDGDYGTWSGASFSTAHAAGAAAMIISADPSIGIGELLGILYSTAVCIDDQTCSIGATCPQPNNTYGHGRIDVYEAVATTIGQGYDLPWLDELPTSGNMEPGQSASISVTFNATGLEPGTYTGGVRVESNDPVTPFTIVPVTLTVTTACEPVSDLTPAFTPLDPGVGEVVTFTASASGTLPIDYAWLFADGTLLDGAEVTYVFETPGAKFVQLKAENGCSIITVDFAVPVDGIVQRILLPLVGK